MTNTAQVPQVDRRVITLPEADRERATPSPDDLRASEDDILRGLDKAAEVDVCPIGIYRGGERVLGFRVQSLGQDVYDNCRDASAKKERAPRYGNVRLATDIDRAQFNAMLIYHATVEEDRKRIWDNRAAWRKYNVINGWDLIRKVLRAGEMDAAVVKIDELSGLGEEVEAERLDLAGNSSRPDGEPTS